MTLNGIDISSVQGGIAVDQVPADFVIVKATEGIGYVNPFCVSCFELAKSSGKLLGLYHFARTGNAIEQANYFYENIKNYVGQAVLFLDWENVSGADETTIAQGPAWAKTWLDEIYRLTGVKAMIYMSESVVTGYDWSSVANDGYGLWMARYGANPVTGGYQQPEAPAEPYWGTPAIYQYNSQTRLNCYPGNLDANVFYGSCEDWARYAGGKAEKKRGEATMVCTYQYTSGEDGAIYYFDGKNVTVLAHEDEWNVLKMIYEANNGRELPHFEWTSEAPWYERLEAVAKRTVEK